MQNNDTIKVSKKNLFAEGIKLKELPAKTESLCLRDKGYSLYGRVLDALIRIKFHVLEIRVSSFRGIDSAFYLY